MPTTRKRQITPSPADPQDRILALENQLLEAEETLRALRSGEVDALIISGSEGDQIYTLKGADQTYRLFIEGMAEGAITLATDGLIAFSNEQFAAMLGVPLEQVIGSRIQDFADAENAEILWSLLSLKDGTRKQELTLITPGGEAVPVFISVSRLQQTAVDCFCAIVTDLTQVKARVMLANSEERFRTLVSIITDVPWSADREGRFIAHQQEWADYTGQSWSEMRDFGWLSAFQDGDRERILTAWKDATKAPALFESQGNLWHAASRAYRYVEVRATPLFVAEGMAREWVGTCTDADDRKRFEIALFESANRVRFMAESMPQKIYTADREGKFDYCNKQWTQFTGLPFDQLLGWGWTASIHPEDLAENIRLWERSIRTGEFFQLVHRFRRHDGLYRWHLTRAEAMRDSQGEVVMWIGSNTDIHEQKEIEAELRRANEDLNQFAFAASHDLQEPLRMITTYSQLLVRSCQGQPDDKTATFLKFITEGTKHMRDLLDDLLTYTQLTGEDEPEPTSVDLNAIFQKTLGNCRIVISETGALVTSDSLPEIPGHPSRFLQLFQNLVGNSIKYRSEETPRVHVAVRPSNDVWRFSVTDNGIGIDPDFHKKIFGVFKRLHGQTIPGTGIGLAICQRIVERYGGQIWVESNAGRGSTFCFTLPTATGVSANA